MSSDERALKELVDRDLPWPTQMEVVAARDRVLDELRATPVEQLRPGIGVATPRFARRPWALAASVAVVILAVAAAIAWPRGAWVYAAGDDGLQVTLADDSRVEMRAHAEMAVGRASDGIQIDLKTGDIIVTAADQRDGHLYVRTKDMTVAVDGTVFLVNAGQDGSRVGVIEGEVRVREGDVETRLRSGEQVATSPTIARRPLTEDITWSRNAVAHLAILDSKRIAQPAETPAPSATPGRVAAASSQAAKAQTASTEFEEASIRPCDPNNLPPGGRRGRGGGAVNMFRMTPGRTYGTCLTLATLVRTAYGEGLLEGPSVVPRGGRPDPPDLSGIPAMGFEAPPYVGGYFLGVEDGLRVRGGPDWVRSELYTIEATAAGSADAQTMRGPMLRALLERRFGLRVHVETEQVQAFTLTVAPGGLKMKEGTCTRSDARSGPPGSMAEAVAAGVREARANLDAARRGETTSGRCGPASALNGPNMLVVGTGIGLPPLGTFVDVPIVDRTGIPDTTLFNYALEFFPDDSLPRSALDFIQRFGAELQMASDPSAVPRAPGIFTALEEQLGLRLERARVPREFIVIDAVEKPAPN